MAAGVPAAGGARARGVEDERLLVRPERAAHLLDVSLSTLYELIARGDLPAVRIHTKVGRRGTYRIRPEALRAFVERLDSTRRGVRAGLARVK